MKRTNRKLILLVAVVLLGTLAAFYFIVLAQRRSSTEQVRPRRAGHNSGDKVLQAGDSLQDAIKVARPGDTIVLQAGAIFVGPIMLPDKGAATGTDADYITIRTSNLNGISGDGERVKPEQASAMPKIVGPTNQTAIGTEPSAHHYKFVGIEFSPASNADYLYNLIDLGPSNVTSLSQLSHHIIFDRCYIHSTGLNKARRGFALNSAETSILNSYVSGFAGAGDETQAIAGWNGSGPFKIINNYLEGGAEVLLFGGADPTIQGLVPSDIEIRRNYFHKPAEWAGRATVKGTLELKNARRALIDANVLDTGIRVTAFALTVRNQDGKAPWSTVQDVDITNNIIRHASTGVNILGNDDRFPSEEAKRINVTNNLFVDLVNQADTTYFIQTSGGDTITVSHNTVENAGNITSAYAKPTKNFSFLNNIVQYNAYGFACFIDGPPCPDFQYCHCFPSGRIKGNIIIDNAGVSANYPIQNNFPVGNFFVDSLERIGFVNHKSGEWQLNPSSKVRNRASDGRDPGVDFELLNASGVNSATSGAKMN